MSSLAATLGATWPKVDLFEVMAGAGLRPLSGRIGSCAAQAHLFETTTQQGPIRRRGAGQRETIAATVSDPRPSPQSHGSKHAFPGADLSTLAGLMPWPPRSKF